MDAHFPREAFPNPRILVADDHRDTVLSVTLHAIILDIEMPEMSGYAVAQELRMHYYGTRAPLLIAISGKWNKPSEKLLSQAIGFDHHFEKPCDPQTLLKLIKPLTAQRASAG